MASLSNLHIKTLSTQKYFWNHSIFLYIVLSHAADFRISSRFTNEIINIRIRKYKTFLYFPKKKRKKKERLQFFKRLIIKREMVNNKKNIGCHAVTRIRTWVIAATTQCTNHYTITAKEPHVFPASQRRL